MKLNKKLKISMDIRKIPNQRRLFFSTRITVGATTIPRAKARASSTITDPNAFPSAISGNVFCRRLMRRG
ncbi:MAG: hypothetical protein GH155_07645 [Spirochaeta sp.]|nr:hypothetical protein [Spirochaeta sp.]